jgi:NAD(P)-dependent dehydrogenase (short-subunit alcohol dehydrogenase family)
MMELAGRTAFITGAAQGIGLGIARAFAKEGARLALVDIDEAALDAARIELSATAEVATAVLDVRDRSRYAQVADELEERLGPVSVLCNNAGVGGSTPVAEMSYPLWDLILGVNLGGAVNGIQTFLPRMIARGELGHIVNTASAAGLAPMGGVTGYVYDTSKVGVIGLSEALGKQLAHEGHPIGVTALCPGPVATNTAATARAAISALDIPDDPAEEERREEQARYMRWLGIPPDEVGPMVVEGIRANRLYVITDRTMAGALALRAKALYQALPPETEHDRRVSGFIAAQTRRHEAGAGPAQTD